MAQEETPGKVEEVAMKILDIKPGAPSDQYIVALSGTPISTSPMNAHSLLQILSPELIPQSESKFRNHFCVSRLISVAPGRMALQVVSYKNLRDLKRLVESVSLRRLAADTKGMPDDILIERPVQIEGRQLELYQEIKEQTIKEIRGEPPNTLHFPTVKLVRLRQVLNSPELVGYYEDSAKWNECDAVIDEVLSNPEAKVVIWTEWREAVHGLTDRYAQYKAFAITGETPQAALEKMEKTFDENDCRVVVATPFKGGTGINWLSRARTAIWIERVWSLVNYRQALKRLARRVKQNLENRLDAIKAEPSRQVFLHATSTVDDLVLKTLTNNNNLADAISTPDELLVRLNRDDVLRFLEKHG